jgi:FSR family fosmidomycin resistance protein-like MFS transporter
MFTALRLSLRRLRGLSVFVLVLLAVEFLDEFVTMADVVALPVIRDELGLSYDEIGLVLTIPALLANLLFEPIIGVLGDVWRRRFLMLAGGVGFLVGTFMIAVGQSYLALMAAFILLYPSSGALVNLAQATLMDMDPKRHEQNMARWTLAGSLGVLGSALVIGAFMASDFGWRGFYWLAAAVTLVVLIALWRMPFPNGVNGGADDDDDESLSLSAFWDGLRHIGSALRRWEVTRWLVMLEFSDLMLDMLYSYLALYFVDVVGVDEGTAALAAVVWTGVGLIGDIAIIPLLERIRGITYLRFSAAIELVLYSAFLLVPGLVPKLILIGIIGFFNAGWYSILQGNLYTVMPGRSASVMVLGNLFGLAHGFFPLAIGLAAERFGLANAMVFPLIACVALLVLLPRRAAESATTE